MVYKLFRFLGILVLCAESHVIVPSDRKEYRNPAMEEVAARHEELPKFCYVDKDCCNGKQGGRTDEAKMYHGMEKKLDSKHLISRIGDTISSEHKRKATFVRGLSDSIYTSNTGDKFKLVLAVGSHRSLTPKEKKCEHVRHHIGCGRAICSRIINKVMIHATIDKENRAKYEGSSSYNPTTILTKRSIVQLCRQRTQSSPSGCQEPGELAAPLLYSRNGYKLCNICPSKILHSILRSARR